MSAKIATINTSASGAIQITEVGGGVRVVARGRFDIGLLPNGTSIIFTDIHTERQAYKHEWGVDSAITMDSGLATTLFDGSTPGVNEIDQLIENLRDDCF